MERSTSIKSRNLPSIATSKSFDITALYRQSALQKTDKSLHLENLNEVPKTAAGPTKTARIVQLRRLNVMLNNH